MEQKISTTIDHHQTLFRRPMNGKAGKELPGFPKASFDEELELKRKPLRLEVCKSETYWNTAAAKVLKQRLNA